MSAEDLALTRLLDEGSALTCPVTAYGQLEDQVYERRGAGGGRTLVVVHGGYFRPSIDRSHARPMARALAAEGWQVVLAEYRRVPGDPAATVADLTELDRALEAGGDDVAAWVGHSAGGALVLWRALAAGLTPRPVVALAPVADFVAAARERLGRDAVRDWLGADVQQAPEVYDRHDPTRLVGANPTRLVAAHPTRLVGASPASGAGIHVVHGDADATVPLRQSAGWPRTVLPGAHHFDVVDPLSPHWPRVLEVIRDAAGPRSR